MSLAEVLPARTNRCTRPRRQCWWLEVGRYHYAGTERLRIQADGGGANDCRRWAWKGALQGLADECGLSNTVMHSPPGTSKWNWIEHRMFSLISGNWAGEPLGSDEGMLQFIRRTRSATGFHCKARLDTTPCAAGQKVSNEERRAVRLKRRPVLPRWNYTIYPRPVSVHGPR